MCSFVLQAEARGAGSRRRIAARARNFIMGRWYRNAKKPR
jgi:hypothetical protein